MLLVRDLKLGMEVEMPAGTYKGQPKTFVGVVVRTHFNFLDQQYEVTLFNRADCHVYSLTRALFTLVTVGERDSQRLERLWQCRAQYRAHLMQYPIWQARLVQDPDYVLWP